MKPNIVRRVVLALSLALLPISGGLVLLALYVRSGSPLPPPSFLWSSLFGLFTNLFTIAVCLFGGNTKNRIKVRRD